MDETKTIPGVEIKSQPGKIFENMIKAMKLMEAIGKNQRNDTQGFKYRGIDDVYNAMHEAFAEAEIFCAPRTISRKEKDNPKSSGKIWVHTTLETIFRFYTTDGSYVDVGPIFSEGEDGGDKGSVKALAHGHKYCLLQAFMVPTKEEKDPDAQTPPDTVRVQPAVKKPAPVNSTQKTAVSSGTNGAVRNAALIDKKMQANLFNEAGKKSIKAESVKELLEGFYKISKSEQLKVFQYEEILKLIQTKSLDQIAQLMVERLANEQMAKEQSK